MYTLDYNHHDQELKLRPPLPKPFTNSAFSATPPSFCCLQIPNIHAWNKPSNFSIGTSLSDFGIKREIISTVPLVSSRWNPTPEQLQALKEMYRRGMKTPSVEQIRKIAAKLRQFGKIEGRNVFYWFQNHKARERQKKRRQLELLAGKKKNLEGKQSGLSRRRFEIEHPKKLPTPSNCSTPSQKSLSMVVEECGKIRWTQVDQKELQQHTKSTETFCPLDLSSKPFSAINFKILLPPENTDLRNLQSGIKGNQTLQLFPVRSNDDLSTLIGSEGEAHDVSRLVVNQFFEFFPTKN